MNEIKPAAGSKKPAKRVGRGYTHGKTSGRGHKGQKSRSGGGVRIGFEGGQMPLQRRLPKSGFTSRVSLVSESLHLRELMSKTLVGADVVTLELLKEKGVVSRNTKQVKVYGEFEITKAVTLEGVRVSKGAKALIEKAGGKVV